METPAAYATAAGSGAAPSKTTPLNSHFKRVWRAHLQVDCGPSPSIIFINASSHREANERVMNILLMLFPSLGPSTVYNAYYNLFSAAELVEQGVSLDQNRRLFETATRGQEVAAWVRDPIFACPESPALATVWSQLPLVCD